MISDRYDIIFLVMTLIELSKDWVESTGQTKENQELWLKNKHYRRVKLIVNKDNLPILEKITAWLNFPLEKMFCFVIFCDSALRQFINSYS